MMGRLKRMIDEFPAHHLLIIIFFVLDGNNEFFPDVSLPESITLFGIFFLSALLIHFACRFFQKNPYRAAVTSAMFIYVFLFGRSIYHHYSRLWDPGTRISNTHFFLVSGVLMILLMFWLSRTSGPALVKFNRFLNMLFFVLILYSTGGILYKYFTPGKQLHLQKPAHPAFTKMTGPKNNIYLLLLDEYQGDDGLNALFGTSGHGPRKMLLQKGFYVPAHPQSNYNYTFYSLPSLMNMSYLEFNDKALDYDLRRVVKAVASMNDKGPFISFLREEGYTIINHSFFNIGDFPSPHVLLTVPHDGFTAIYSRTLPGWAQEDLLHILPYNSLQKIFQTYFYRVYTYNNQVIREMGKTMDAKAGSPRFVYAHLLIPHPPMLTDSSGNLKNIRAAMYETNMQSPSLKPSYAAYISYANKILEKMVSDIQRKDPAAAIIVASDHGFRSYTEQPGHIFNNQCAVYIPGARYEGFYDSVSLVNLLRLVLNNACGQKIPLVSDSTRLAK